MTVIARDAMIGYLFQFIMLIATNNNQRREKLF